MADWFSRNRHRYPADWPDIARRVKDAAGWRCVRCDHPHDPKAGRTLTIHHADKQPSNSAWWNLMPLCQSCHLKIQGRVKMDRVWMFEHTPWMRPYVAGYYAHRRGLPDDRQSVEANMEDLLDWTQLPVERAASVAATAAAKGVGR